MTSKTTIFIVDDHKMMIDGISSLLQNNEEFEIIGSATNGFEALEKMRIAAADILITDINMPEMNGIELSQTAKKEFPTLKILALSMHSDSSMISTMLLAGVSGYILKNTGKDELINALKTIKKGELFFSNEVSAEMMKSISNSTKAATELPEINLTTREKEIVLLISKEFSNAQIAQQLFISERTVESHRKNIFRKTNTKSVVGLIKFAYENKLIE